MGFLPICRRAASMPHPFGLFPTNTAVLDAANGKKARYCVTSVLSLMAVPYRVRLTQQKTLTRLSIPSRKK